MSDELKEDNRGFMSFRDFSKGLSPAVQLFHKDVGIPAPLKSGPPVGLRVNYGRHATESAQNDRYGNCLHLLPATTPAKFQLIEVEAQGKTILKWVIRFPLAEGDKRDLIMVVQPDGFVRTVWINLHDDKHSTLKRHLYTSPNQYTRN
jgi:hypothetical protein